jgi:hypothetical protein
MVAACGTSASTRTITTTPVEFEEAEEAAQPAPFTPAPEPPATGSATPPASEPATGSAGSLPDSNGPIVFGMLDGEAALEDAWDRWNAGKTSTYDAVFEIAVLANRARPLAMSDELMVVALMRAVELSTCDPERLGRIRLLAIAVNTSPHTEELDADLATLADMGPIECNAAK